MSRLKAALRMALVPAMVGAFSVGYSAPSAANDGGLYTGLHGGYGWGTFAGCGTWGNPDPAPPVAWPPPCADGGQDYEIEGPFNGWLGGGQIGFDHWAGPLFVGTEMAFSLANLLHYNPDIPVEMSLDHLITGTLHVGLGTPQFGVYGVVGIGVGHVSHMNGDSGCTYMASVNGPVFGAGARVGIGESVDLFVEWNRLAFNPVTTICELDGGGSANNVFTTNADIIKFGLNFRPN